MKCGTRSLAILGALALSAMGLVPAAWAADVDRADSGQSAQVDAAQVEQSGGSQASQSGATSAQSGAVQASAEQTQSGARQAAPTTQPAQPSVPASSEQSGEERPGLSLASLPAAALAAPQDEASQNEASPITLDLYTLTDVHGHIQQVAKKGIVREARLPAMNCYLKKARATNPNSSFTLLGDNIGASPYISGALKENPTIAALNTMNPLASTIGNHELDMGQAVFKQRVSAGGAQAVAEVNNSLVDAHASDAASVITTDGAGQASVDVTVVGACEGKAAG